MIIEMKYEMKLKTSAPLKLKININENKADDLIQALIDTNDDDYIKAIRDYVQYTTLNEVRKKYEDR